MSRAVLVLPAIVGIENCKVCSAAVSEKIETSSWHEQRCDMMISEVVLFGISDRDVVACPDAANVHVFRTTMILGQ